MGPNVHQAITQLEALIKADAGCKQPWRNKAVGRLLEVRALYHSGKTFEIMRDINGENDREQVIAENGGCICPDGAIDTTCRVHGK